MMDKETKSFQIQSGQLQNRVNLLLWEILLVQEISYQPLKKMKMLAGNSQNLFGVTTSLRGWVEVQAP
jgi:hypothetical protein